MATPSQIRTLVLYADYTSRLSYYDDWMDAFARAPQLATRSLNICDAGVMERMRTEVAEADLIVLLHSTNGDTTLYVEPFASVLADRKGILLSFVGNEVNLPGSPIAAKRAFFRAIQPDYIATQLPLDAGQHLWGDLPTKGVLAVPHALNPDAFAPVIEDSQRPIDIGVRAVRYLPHLGDRDRNQLHDLFAHHLQDSSLRIDISTARLNRTGWSGFLNSCKGTVSTEAGSWWVEQNDETVDAIREWTLSQTKGRMLVIPNDSPFRKLGHKLPWWLRAALRRVLSGGVVRHESTLNETLSFDEIYDRFFKDRPRPSYYAKCISSRHFDAVGTKTCQILVEGRYNDVLVAGEHYISLSHDLSNIDDALRQFKDAGERRRITDTAYAFVRENHTYDQRITSLIAAVQ